MTLTPEQIAELRKTANLDSQTIDLLDTIDAKDRKIAALEKRFKEHRGTA